MDFHYDMTDSLTGVAHYLEMNWCICSNITLILSQ